MSDMFYIVLLIGAVVSIALAFYTAKNDIDVPFA